MLDEEPLCLAVRELDELEETLLGRSRFEADLCILVRRLPEYGGAEAEDARAAQRAGTSFVAVLSGVTKAHEFDEFSSLGILQNVGRISAELLARADTIRD